LAAQIKIMHRAAVILGVDDGDDRLRQFDEILRAADLGQRAVLVEQVLQRDGIGDLAALDQLADRFIDAAVQRIGKMFRPQEFVDPVEDEVVGQDGAEQGLLGVVIHRRCALRYHRIAASQPRDVVSSPWVHRRDHNSATLPRPLWIE
jgi:hypothetical protein